MNNPLYLQADFAFSIVPRNRCETAAKLRETLPYRRDFRGVSSGFRGNAGNPINGPNTRFPALPQPGFVSFAASARDEPNRTSWPNGWRSSRRRAQAEILTGVACVVPQPTRENDRAPLSRAILWGQRRTKPVPIIPTRPFPASAVARHILMHTAPLRLPRERTAGVACFPRSAPGSNAIIPAWACIFPPKFGFRQL